MLWILLIDIKCPPRCNDVAYQFLFFVYFSFLSYGTAKFPITAGIDKARLEAQSTKEIPCIEGMFLALTKLIFTVLSV